MRIFILIQYYLLIRFTDLARIKYGGRWLCDLSPSNMRVVVTF